MNRKLLVDKGGFSLQQWEMNSQLSEQARNYFTWHRNSKLLEYVCAVGYIWKMMYAVHCNVPCELKFYGKSERLTLSCKVTWAWSEKGLIDK